MDQVRVTSELALQARSSRQVAIVDDVDTGGSENNLRWGMPSTQSADYSGVSLKLDKEMIEPSCGREGYRREHGEKGREHDEKSREHGVKSGDHMVRSILPHNLRVWN